MSVPHIFVEYSSNVARYHDVEGLLDIVHRSAQADGLAPADGVRSRAVERSSYRIADSADDYAFIAITARIGPGRSTEDKQRFLASILDAAEHHVEGESGPLAIAWSAEVQEIDADLRINKNHVRTRIQDAL